HIEKPSQKSSLFVAIRRVGEDFQELHGTLHVTQVRSSPVDFARPEEIYEAGHYVQRKLVMVVPFAPIVLAEEIRQAGRRKPFAISLLRAGLHQEASQQFRFML